MDDLDLPPCCGRGRHQLNDGCYACPPLDDLHPSHLHDACPGLLGRRRKHLLLLLLVHGMGEDRRHWGRLPWLVPRLYLR